MKVKEVRNLNGKVYVYFTLNKILFILFLFVCIFKSFKYIGNLLVLDNSKFILIWFIFNLYEIFILLFSYVLLKKARNLVSIDYLLIIYLVVYLFSVVNFFLSQNIYIFWFIYVVGLLYIILIIKGLVLFDKQVFNGIGIRELKRVLVIFLIGLLFIYVFKQIFSSIFSFKKMDSLICYSVVFIYILFILLSEIKFPNVISLFLKSFIYYLLSYLISFILYLFIYFNNLLICGCNKVYLFIWLFIWLIHNICLLVLLYRSFYLNGYINIFIFKR